MERSERKSFGAPRRSGPGRSRGGRRSHASPCRPGAAGPTPRGICIGPVYTPPDRRGRGYASNLVAEVSQRQIASDRSFCVLFTDLANPTSNHIYQAIGYTPVVDAEQYLFPA